MQLLTVREDEQAAFAFSVCSTWHLAVTKHHAITSIRLLQEQCCTLQNTCHMNCSRLCR